MRDNNTSDGEKHFLFVVGPPRSGTTALGRILNSHGKIGIGSERFKNILNRKNLDKLCPDLFDESNFFDFSDGYTNRVPGKTGGMERYYSDMRKKYPQLSYIGDKVPGAFRVSADIYKRFKNIKFVFIIRDIYETASSWQTRAERVDDTWPSQRTATHAVNPWNASISIFLDLKKQHPDDFFMVDYETFFDGNPDDVNELEKICAFLNLQVDRKMCKSFHGARSEYQAVLKSKALNLDNEAMDFINQNANFNAYRSAIDSSCGIELLRKAS
jgi:hypothetical protein